MSISFEDHIVSELNSNIHVDPTCILSPPCSLHPLPSYVLDRVSAALATRYNVRKAIAKRHVPHRIEQWGKVRRIDGGDTMFAVLLGKGNLDRRDATHIRVCYQHCSNIFILTFGAVPSPDRFACP